VGTGSLTFVYKKMVGNQIIVIVTGVLICGIFNWWLVVNKNVMLASFDGIIQKEESIAYNNGKNNNNNNNNNHNNNNNNTIFDKRENDDHDDHQQSFEWNFIDFTKKPFCGSDKCLFQSSSFNQQHDNNDQQQVGYIVSKDSKHDSTLDDGWKISQYLVSKFGIKHFQLEAPQKVNISMNTTNAFLNYYLSVKEDDVRTIQKIRIAQNGSQELRLHHSEEEIFSRLDEFVSTMSANNNSMSNDNNNNEDNTTIIISSQLLLSFLETLSNEVETTFSLLQCEPLLALDFQIFVDIRGNIFHLDFDRVLTQFGGLRGYNQIKFDEKVRSRLTASTELLATINKWITLQSTRYNYTVASDTNNNDDSRRHNNVFKCNSDWEKEESMILNAKNLSCLAIERVAIARQTNTTTMNNSKDRNSGSNARKGEKRLRHPLAVALLQRVIRNGFYNSDTTEFWDCNVYGDRN
jgi:hypothetical protein